MTRPSFGFVTPESLPLFTDLYELRMMQGYVEREHVPTATFGLFARELPVNRGYLLAAGLEQLAWALENVEFGERALSYLAEQGFSEGFLEYLSAFSFSGEVRAVPEGTPVFPNEPLVEVTAPIPEAQFFETVAINQVGFQTLLASKAARMREAVERGGGEQSLVDFGSRRAHGTDAGVKAARAAFVGGFDGTSNVAAGEAFGVPVFGTMAHSWVQSYASEREAFEAFVEEYGEASVLLVDTYDTVRGAETAMAVADDAGVDVAGVRLDSGDLVALSKRVADVVGDAGIFVSSSVDEYAIREFLAEGGVATGFGPGTALVTSADAPTLECVYKLVAVERDGAMAPSMKLSTGKVTYPGAKSVRRVTRDGEYAFDVLDSRDAAGGGGSREGEELLVSIFEGGERVDDRPDLEAIRDAARRNRRALPAGVRRLEDPDPYEVRIGDALAAATDDLRARLEAEYR